MFIPLFYLFGIPSVQKITNKIQMVLSQSIWLIFSLIICFSLFGMIARLVFSKEHQFFKDEVLAGLTFVQLATMDGVGAIAQ